MFKLYTKTKVLIVMQIQKMQMKNKMQTKHDKYRSIICRLNAKQLSSPFFFLHCRSDNLTLTLICMQFIYYFNIFLCSVYLKVNDKKIQSNMHPIKTAFIMHGVCVSFKPSTMVLTLSPFSTPSFSPFNIPHYFLFFPPHLFNTHLILNLYNGLF